ncbi:MAG TPA: MATE family efflux transporter [Longimicrobiales bacterium]|nr:MATE family efflux transporter [Longimicrobiales bacterium]
MSIKLQIRNTNWLEVISNGLRGRGGSPTEGPIVPAIITLAVPMVLEMVMESLFAVVNIFWVGHLGSAATASIGLTESLLAIVYTVAAGLSMGVMAVVARRSGEKDEEGASDAAFQTILLGLFISLVLGVVGGIFARDFLRLMGADANVLRVGGSFATIMLAGNGSVLMLFLLNAAFRGSADAAIAMRVLWLANIINLVLDPCLIFGLGPFPEMGVTGTAIATTIGRSTAVLVQLLVLFTGTARLKLAARHVRLHVEVMWRVIKLSGMGTLQVFIATASWIGLVRVLSSFGSDALAGYTIGIRIVIFALLPAWGLANAAATMVGQNLGAKQPERANEAVWIAGFMNLAFLGSLGVVFIIAAPFITGFFGGNPTTTGYAIQCLRIVSAGFFFYAFGMVLTNSFNGAGDTRTPMLLNLFCFWLWEIPIAWLLSTKLQLGPVGVFYAITIAFSTVAIASAVLWRRGRWRTTAV